MIDVYVTFENVAQVRQFRKKLIQDFRCPDISCTSCKEADICDVIVRFYDDLGKAILKYERDK